MLFIDVDLYFDIAGGQIDGARDYQEDAYLTTYLDDEGPGHNASALVVMADGMGGHAAGNVASKLVVSTFTSTFTDAFGEKDLRANLQDALGKANAGLSESIRETPALDGMGCTMVAGALIRGKLWWVSVGDSHLYHVRDRELKKKNEDHSYGGYLDRMQGQGVTVEPEQGLARNMLMSAMTGEDIAEIDCPTTPVQLLPGDRLIIASDGLDTLSRESIVQLAARSQAPKQCVEALLTAVEDAAQPRQDNTTVVVVDCLRRASTQSTSQEAALTSIEPKNDHRSGGDPVLAAKQVETAQMKGDRRPAVGRVPHNKPVAKGNLRPLGSMIGAALLVLGLGGGGFFAYKSGMLGLDGGGASVGEPEATAKLSSVPTVVAPQTPSAVAPIPRQLPAPVPTSSDRDEFQDRLSSGGSGPMMVIVPAGSYRMGSSSSVSQDERPVHLVKVAGLAVGKYEVRVDEFRRFARSSGLELHPALQQARADHPVTYVTWDEALAYTKWLTEETGRAYRLPSEAEWEYFARAGSEGLYWWGFHFKAGVAHCFDCDTGLDPRSPTNVGRFTPNGFNLHDTAGNVMEWVYDCYHTSYQGAPSDGAVFEGGKCGWRVARGGSYAQPLTSMRSAKRNKLKSAKRFGRTGFRVVAGR